MGHGIGKELAPYRIEWRPDLTTGWVLICHANTHDEMVAHLAEAHRLHKGQVRSIAQHVIEVKGLGA